jgi:hypothetical protein
MTGSPTQAEPISTISPLTEDPEVTLSFRTAILQLVYPLALGLNHPIKKFAVNLHGVLATNC